MSSMKNISGLLVASLLMGGMNPSLGQDLRPDEIDTTPKQPPIPKGCKRYEFEGFTCVATSKKNALRKYENFKLKQVTN